MVSYCYFIFKKLNLSLRIIDNNSNSFSDRQVIIKIVSVFDIFSGTTVVFVSFSISSLLAERGRWLYLGGTLISLLNIMVLFSFVNLLLRWSFFYQAHLYIGLFLMCGFVMYDTQLIIEKYHMGSKDFILHSLDLFVDFIGIFRYLLIILTQKVKTTDHTCKYYFIHEI